MLSRQPQVPDPKSSSKVDSNSDRVKVKPGGGESGPGIEHLRLQSTHFGSVPSESTVFRVFREIDSSVLAGLVSSVATVRR